ncbi:MAG: hypothetical protein ACRD0J_02480, partial [Acidimicrobiales bacterium]
MALALLAGTLVAIATSVVAAAPAFAFGTSPAGTCIWSTNSSNYNNDQRTCKMLYPYYVASIYPYSAAYSSPGAVSNWMASRGHNS